MACGGLCVWHPDRKSINSKWGGEGGNQSVTNCHHEQMFLRRKPLVRFDALERAQIIIPDHLPPSKIEETKNKQTQSSGSSNKRSALQKTEQSKKTGKRKKEKSQSSKPVVSKGFLTIRVPGYKDLQKIELSKVVKNLPLKHLRQAARKTLVASGKKPQPRKKKTRKLQPQFFFYDG